MLTAFRFTTAGESHGEGMYVIVEGVPAGLPLGPDDAMRVTFSSDRVPVRHRPAWLPAQ
jgi:chorismate synthase